MEKAGGGMKRVALAIWHGWLSFAELFGKLMFFLIMMVLYFTLVTLIAIPHRLLSDPLQLRDPHRSARPIEHFVQRQG